MARNFVKIGEDAQRDTDTEGRWSCEGGGGNQTDTATG